MKPFILGFLGVLLAANPPPVASQVNPPATASALVADPVTQELRTVLLADDAAHDEVNRWLHEFDALATTNQTATASAALNQRIRARFEPVRQGYEHFLRNHPDHARGYLAFGSFLNEIGDEEGAKTQYENSKQLDPKNPAVWNNLANYYGEHGPVTNAFAYFAEAIRLKPDEPVYYRNFAATVSLFHTEAAAFYHLTLTEVFDKAIGLYRQTLRLAPENFLFATDYAESFYSIRPMRTNDALAAWTNALHVAHTDAERQGVNLHLARLKIATGRFAEAQTHLAAVTNAAFLDLKNRLVSSLAEGEKMATTTAALSATNELPPTNPPATGK